MTKHDAMYAFFSPKIEELLKNVLKFNFSASTKDADLKLIADYVLKYKRFNNMYKVFNCQVTL